MMFNYLLKIIYSGVIHHLKRLINSLSLSNHSPKVFPLLMYQFYLLNKFVQELFVVSYSRFSYNSFAVFQAF